MRRRLLGSQELSAREATWMAIVGEQVDEDVLRHALLSSDKLFGPSGVLGVLGLSGSPLLAALLEEPGWSDEVRGAAAWWTRTGSRLVDPVPGATAG